MEKTADAFRTISEVASDLDLPQHVLRFWETRFLQVRPLKRAGGRRYYRPGDIAVLRNIRRLLYDEGYTIKGVQRLMKERGVRELRETPPANDDVTAAAPAREIVEADEGLDDASAEGDRVVPNGATATDRSVLRECLAIIEDCERILRTAGSA